jgi:hypothetical protein
MTRWLQLTLVLVLFLGAALVIRYASLGIVTTGVASLGLVVGALAGLRRRVWGVLLLVAVGSSFATAAVLDMTDAPRAFLLIALSSIAPALVVVRPMWRFDAMATAAALALSVLSGVGGAAMLKEHGDDAARGLGGLHARLDAMRGERLYAGIECDAPDRFRARWIEGYNEVGRDRFPYSLMEALLAVPDRRSILCASSPFELSYEGNDDPIRARILRGCEGYPLPSSTGE